MSIYDKSMGKEARASMEFAEDSRDTEWRHPSYSALLYQGKVKWDLLHPFPQQSVEDKKTGDEFLAKFQTFIEERFDADAVEVHGGHRQSHRFLLNKSFLQSRGTRRRGEEWISSPRLLCVRVRPPRVPRPRTSVSSR